MVKEYFSSFNYKRSMTRNSRTIMSAAYSEDSFWVHFQRAKISNVEMVLIPNFCFLLIRHLLE